MTPIIVLQALLTWALLSGMLALGLHVAILTLDDFREKFFDLVRQHMASDAFKFGQQQGERFGPLVWVWMCFFIAPLALPVLWVLGTAYLTFVRGKLMLQIAKKARVEYLIRTGRDPGLFMDGPAAAMPSIKGWNEQHRAICAGIARVAYTTVLLGEEDPDDKIPQWDDASEEVRRQNTDRVLAMVENRDTYMDSVKEEGAELTRLKVFFITAMTCVDGLEDAGFHVTPPKVTAVKETPSRSQEPTEEFPPEVQ